MHSLAVLCWLVCACSDARYYTAWTVEGRRSARMACRIKQPERGQSSVENTRHVRHAEKSLHDSDEGSALLVNGFCHCSHTMSSIRLSIRPFHHSAVARPCGGLSAVGPAGRDVDPLIRCSAANASSVMLLADVGS